MAGDVAGGFEQAEGVHHVFGVVALSVCLRALVARFVAFRQPLLIGSVFAAVAAVSVLVEGKVGERGFTFGNGAEGEVGGFGFERDAVVAARAVWVVKQGVEFAGVGDFDQTDPPLLHSALRKPVLQRHGLRTFYDVAEIEHAFLFRRHRVADFLVQPACFFDLPVGVSGETLAAGFGHKPFGFERVHQRRAVAHAVGWGGEQLQRVRVALQQKLDKPPQFVIHDVVGFVADLRDVFHAVKHGFGQVKHAFDVGIGFGRRQTVGAAAGNGFEQKQVLCVQIFDGEHFQTTFCEVVGH